MKPDELDTLINRYLDGAATADELSALSESLETDEQVRCRYVRLARLHAELKVRLPSRAEPGPVRMPVIRSQRPRLWPRPFRRPLLLAACTAGLLLACWFVVTQFRAQRAGAGWVVKLHDSRWVDRGTELKAGDAVRRGQVLQLSSGTVAIRFATGADVTVIGPAIFEVTSSNSGFLTLGHVKVSAVTPQSKGFTVQTRTARVVDVGTEFVTAAAADGQSRVDVTVGEVFVLLDGVKSPQRLRTGDALSVEAGRAQVLVRIERGDGTAAFRFPTIEPPSPRDLADASTARASIRVVRGGLHTTATIPSGPVDLLLDGRGQTRPNSPAESVFFDNNASGLLLLDLGQVTSVSKINTYSWHQSPDPANRVRAVQKFTLYGYDGDQPPPTDGHLSEAGWVQLARVNSDDFFNVMQPIDRPAQQACSISGANGPIGRYRYLLWAVEPTQSKNPQFFNNTFYAEFDVYGVPAAGGQAVERPVLRRTVRAGGRQFDRSSKSRSGGNAAAP